MPRKAKGLARDHVPVCGRRGKKTSIGYNNLGTSTMNKNMKRSYKKYRGQGL